MILKKAKHFLGHLRENGRIGKQIIGNIVKTQIFSGLQRSILKRKYFFKQFWADEIVFELKELGSILTIPH